MNADGKDLVKQIITAIVFGLIYLFIILKFKLS